MWGFLIISVAIIIIVFAVLLIMFGTPCGKGDAAGYIILSVLIGMLPSLCLQIFMPEIICKTCSTIEYDYSTYECSLYRVGNGAVIDYSVDGVTVVSNIYHDILNIEPVKNVSVTEPRIILRRTGYDEEAMNFWSLWGQNVAKITYKPVVVASSFEEARKWIDEQVG